MSKIKAVNTKPEVRVRKFLHSLGFRFRIHLSIEGKPDIVFTKSKKIIFIHGCFWHKHGCKNSVMPKSNMEFWEKKLNSNVERDKKNKENLQNNGWEIKVIWECEIEENFNLVKEDLINFLKK